MCVTVGVEHKWLSAALGGSARFLLSFSPSSSSSSSFSFITSPCARAIRSGGAEKIVSGLGLKRAPSRGKCDVGKPIFTWGGILISKEVGRLKGQSKWYAEECPTGVPHFRPLRLLSTSSRRAPEVIASAVSLTNEISAEEITEVALKDFILNGSRTTSIAHKVWQGVVRPGDTVIDATCGNGLDTLMLAKLVLQEGTAGYVIGLDLQQSALDNTSALLDRELNSSQREKVSLLQLCHSQLDKVVDESSVRLVAFNLGYLPGGDKSFITRAETTLRALRAAVNVLEPQGIISIMSYIGHPGGREEYCTLREFVASLPTQDWVCSHLEWVNRPLCPHLMFLLRK